MLRNSYKFLHCADCPGAGAHFLHHTSYIIWSPYGLKIKRKSGIKSQENIGKKILNKIFERF